MSDFRLLIDGRLVDGDSTLDVINPATEEIFACCARASKAQLDEAVAAAQDFQPAGASGPERSTRLVGGPSGSGLCVLSAGRRVGSTPTARRISSLAAVIRVIRSRS